MAANATTGELVVRDFNGVQIDQRAADGYLHATAMCMANGKKLNNYLRNIRTRVFLNELSAETRISVSDLVQVRKGGSINDQGTYVHPRVAMNLAQWISPTFDVMVSGWVIDILTTGKAELACIGQNTTQVPTNAPLPPPPPPPPSLPAVISSPYAIVIPNRPDGTTVPADHPRASEQLAEIAENLEPIRAIPELIKQLRHIYDSAIPALFLADGMSQSFEWKERHAEYLMGVQAKAEAAKATPALPALTDAERIARLERQVAELSGALSGVGKGPGVVAGVLAEGKKGVSGA